MKNPLNYLLICCFTLFSLFLIAQDAPPSGDIYRLQNVATGEFLTAAPGSSQAVTMSASGETQNTHWTFVESAIGSGVYNIDSESESGGTGILRAPGAGGPGGAYVVVSTLKAPPATDSDKIWTIYHDATEDTYRFGSNTTGRFLYHEMDGTVTHHTAPDTDDRSNWKLVPLTVPIPVETTLRFQNVATGEFLTTATGSNLPVTMSASGEAVNTHWTLVESASESGVYNIDSESESGGTGILRGPGAGASTGAYVVVSTLKAPPATDTDKIWTISYNATTDTYRFGSNTTGRFLYQEMDGTVTHHTAPDTDDRSNWKLIPFVQHQIPVEIPFRFQNVETEEFLTTATGSNLPVTMSASGETVNTHWTLVESASESGVYNIDSESESGGTGILRATGAGNSYAVVSTLKAPPATDTDKIWNISYNSTTDTYRFESNTAGRFLYQEMDGTVTHNTAPDTDNRSNWKLVPLGVAPDEDTNPDLTCPASGEFENNDTREVDIPNSVNVGTADDRSCYSDYSEVDLYEKTWGVYNITAGSNHWDGSTLQPRIERSLPRSGESGVGSYAKFTGTVRILEVGDAGSFNDDGSYLIQAKGKHTGGGGSPDPAICLYLAKPVYGTGVNADKQVAFDIYAERVLERGGEGSGREVVLLKRVNKNEEITFELEIGFRADPNDATKKIHYCDAVIGGEAFNYNIPDPDRGLESGIRYGAYRVKGGRAQFRWANTTYQMEEVVDDNGSDPGPLAGIYNLRNVETGEFLTAAPGSTQPVTMSATGEAVNTHWTLVESGAYHNIDSESETGGTGILRAPGANASTGAYVVLSTLKAPPAADTDKTWTIHYDETSDTYRFESRTAGRYLYQNADGTVTHSSALATDNRSVWEAILIPLQSEIAEQICEGEIYTFNGQDLTTSGIYRDTLQTASQRDSIIVLTLTVVDTSQTQLTESICQGSSYPFDGQNLTTSGTYRDTLQNSNQCDSIIVLNLTVLPTTQTQLTESICQGSSYPFDGQNLTTSGTYRDTLQNVNQCDSIIVLNLTVLPTAQTQLTESICQGSSYPFDGQNLTTSGTYRDTLQNVNQCDSIIVLNLTVLPTAQTQLTESICQGSSYLFDGQNLTTSGTYRDTLQNVNQCDSIIVLNLTVQPAPQTQLTENICQGDSYTFNNQTLTSSGVYQQVLQTSNQCDSIIVLTLTVTDCGNCTDELVLDETPITKGTYEAGLFISSAGTIVMDTVTYQAGVMITLKPGFHAPAGSHFVAKIDECTNSDAFTSEEIEGTTADQRFLKNPVNSFTSNELKVSPNPFYQTAKIDFKISTPQEVRLVVYSMEGRLIKILQDGYLESGDYAEFFNPQDSNGRLYLVVLQTEQEILTKKIINLE